MEGEAKKEEGKDKTAKTPNFDKLMENGVYFEQAIASTDATVLALNSIFNATFTFVRFRSLIQYLYSFDNVIYTFVR